MNRISSFQNQAREAFNSFLDERQSVLSQDETVRLSESRSSSKTGEIVQPIDTTSVPLQKALRPLFGKGQPGRASIGGHPDYQHLEDTNRTELGPITTLFVDMEGSTKLGLLHDPEKAFLYKDAILRSAIDIVKAFDGHVHRLMGDAVMAFFGSVDGSTEAGVVDGLNCAASLMMFFEEAVQPQIESKGFLEPFGIRIGIDFGPKSKVLWSSYGMERMSEVTATSYHVDVAAKLQQNAGRNEIMIGQSLKNHVDFPDMLLEVPTRIRDGEEKKERYVRPNYCGPDGSPVNYRKYRLLWKDYLSWSPFQKIPASKSNGIEPVEVDVEIHSKRRGTFTGETYPAASRPLQKRLGLKFTYDKPKSFDPPYTIRTKVQNHGKEANKANACDRDPQTHRIKNWKDQRNFGHWETTQYRGLHYLDFKLQKGSTIRYATRYGVYIK